MAGNKKTAGTVKPAKTAKGKAGSIKEDTESGSKLKPATAINSRHILV